MDKRSVAELWGICMKAPEMLADSLGAVVLITAGAGIFGAVLGFLLCILRAVGNKSCRLGAWVWIRLLRGLPALVLCMILCDMVSGVGGRGQEWLAILCFGLCFAARAADAMQGGIDAVGSVQSEAAQALGYTQRKALLKIILPQATEHFVPVLRKELASLARQAAVIGYLMAGRLTPAYAAIYFVVSWLFAALIGRMALPQIVKRRIYGWKGVRQL